MVEEKRDVSGKNESSLTWSDLGETDKVICLVYKQQNSVLQECFILNAVMRPITNPTKVHVFSCLVFSHILAH